MRSLSAGLSSNCSTLSKGEHWRSCKILRKICVPLAATSLSCGCWAAAGEGKHARAVSIASAVTSLVSFGKGQAVRLMRTEFLQGNKDRDVRQPGPARESVDFRARTGPSRTARPRPRQPAGARLGPGSTAALRCSLPHIPPPGAWRSPRDSSSGPAPPGREARGARRPGSALPPSPPLQGPQARGRDASLRRPWRIACRRAGSQATRRDHQSRPGRRP